MDLTEGHMPKRTGEPLRRADLFVVRLWRRDAGGPGEAAAEPDKVGGAQWQGRVQRAVSGEAHAFQGWRGLIDVLEAMLAGTRPVGGQESSAPAPPTEQDGGDSPGESP
jgi:hypothetical protein